MPTEKGYWAGRKECFGKYFSGIAIEEKLSAWPGAYQTRVVWKQQLQVKPKERYITAVLDKNFLLMVDILGRQNLSNRKYQ